MLQGGKGACAALPAQLELMGLRYFSSGTLRLIQPNYKNISVSLCQSYTSALFTPGLKSCHWIGSKPSSEISKATKKTKHPHRLVSASLLNLTDMTSKMCPGGSWGTCVSIFLRGSQTSSAAAFSFIQTFLLQACWQPLNKTRLKFVPFRNFYKLFWLIGYPLWPRWYSSFPFHQCTFRIALPCGVGFLDNSIIFRWRNNRKN